MEGELAEILDTGVDADDRIKTWTRINAPIGSRGTESWAYDNAGNNNSVTRNGNTENCRRGQNFDEENSFTSFVIDVSNLW